MKHLTAFLFPLLLLTGCSLFQLPDRFDATPTQFSELDGWERDDHLAALDSFNKSCRIMAEKPKPETTGSKITIDADIWNRLCLAAEYAGANRETARIFFETQFVPYRIANRGNEEGLFTGYYEPLLYGNMVRQGDFKYPVYAAPADLKNNKPYFSRAEIDAGALAGKKLELVWVDDPVMLFFTHIQGSGRVRLPNGDEFIVGYADQNGHGYVTLGKIMIDEGLLARDNVNFFTVRQWLYDHPNEAFAMMARNPSYIFFKRLDRKDVLGAIGAPLTPKRSLAVDARYIPYGLPVYLESSLPPLDGGSMKPFEQLLIAQDTGGAIKKPVRGDVFFGHGEEAEYLAGYMKQPGRYTLLVPYGVAVPHE